MEWFILLLIPTFAVVTRALDYSDLEALGVSCQPRDKCSSSTNRTFSRSSCECDGWCHYYSDCCVDGPPARGHSGMCGRIRITCIPIDSFQGVYAIRKCKSSWNGSDIVRRKCENIDYFSDPLMSRPTFDTRTNLTYRNRYCSECNYANLRNLSSWDVTLTCSSLEDINTLYGNVTQDFLVENIRSGSSWGVYHWNGSLGGMAFYPCEVSFRLPQNLTPHVRYCRPDVISTCATNWTRDVVRNHCLSYMAVIYVGDQAYRNAHCALCNRVSVSNRTCELVTLTARKRPSLSFTLLLDVNRSDGDTVGETNRCSSGETYDPFFNRCRTLQCALPNHVLREGRCVPQ